MSYISNLKGRTIIDTTDAVHLDNKNYHRGYEPRDYGAAPFGSFADKFPQNLYIPSSDWPDMIEELDRTGGQPVHHKRLAGFPSLNQEQTNYCWINAPTQCFHYVRAMQGLPHIPLSPASVGAPMKNYRNRGGWGSEGLKYISKHGLVPQSMWPANAIDRKYDTPETQAIRVKFRAEETYELPDRSFHALVSCLLMGWPVSVGYNWWRHQVTACAVHIQGSDPESDTVIEIDNSWGNWGDNGHGILTREKGTPDDSTAVRVTTPSV